MYNLKNVIKTRRKAFFLPIIILIFLFSFVNIAANVSVSGDQIADKALQFTGQNGGECIIFVRNIMSSLNIKIRNQSYRNSYLDAGAVEVGASEAARGDIIQLSNDSDEANYYNGMHTAIINSVNYNGSFEVIDSNWGHFENGNWVLDHMVRVHSWNPSKTREKYPNLTVHFYRFSNISANLENNSNTNNSEQTVDNSGSNEQESNSNSNSNETSNQSTGQSPNQPGNQEQESLWQQIVDWFHSILGTDNNDSVNENNDTSGNTGTSDNNNIDNNNGQSGDSAIIATPQGTQPEISIEIESETVAETTSGNILIPVPSKPYSLNPYDWYQSIGSAPTLRWGGDGNSDAFLVMVTSSKTGIIESGWLQSKSWTPNLPNDNNVYAWKVKARNLNGEESAWSDESHFSISPASVKFEGDITFSPASPSSANEIIILASTTGWGGVGITLRVSVNKSNDGSANGEWIILKELGVPKFNTNDAPRWYTNGWANGTYRVRVEAKGPNDPFWEHSTIAESLYTLVNK